LYYLFRAGFGDARRAAAEIAAEADRELEAANKRAEKAEADAARLRKALKMVEWLHLDGAECPWCRGWRSRGHKPDCARQLALAGEGEGK